MNFLTNIETGDVAPFVVRPVGAVCAHTLSGATVSINPYSIIAQNSYKVGSWPFKPTSFDDRALRNTLELAHSKKGTHSPMSLIQVAYASRPFGFDDASLMGILGTAQRNNQRNDITGSLICRDDLYLQLLEGPADAVEKLFVRIAQDDRHVEVTRLFTNPIETRLFGDWAMRHDPVKSWMWSRADVASDVIARTPQDAILAIFKRVASEAEQDKN